MKRLLGPSEQLALCIDKVISQNIVFVANSIKSFEPNDLKTALAILQKRHPLLCSCIDYDGHLFFGKNEACIPLKTIISDFDGEWKNQIVKEIKQPFDMKNGPLLRITVIKTKNKSYILATFHHVITDGYSCVYFLIDLIEIINARYEKKQVISKVYPNRDSLESYLGVDDGNILSENLLIKKNIPSVNFDAILEQCILTKEETSKVVLGCKRNNITVHSAMSAAINHALGFQLQSNNVQYKYIVNIHPINFKRYLKDIDRREFGYYISRIDVLLNMETNESIIETAKILGAKIKQKNTIHSLSKSINDLGSSVKFIAEHPEYISGMKANIPNVLVSNLGKFSGHGGEASSDYCCSPGYFDCNTVVSGEYSVAIVALTFNQQLQVNFHFPKKTAINIKAIKHDFICALLKFAFPV